MSLVSIIIPYCKKIKYIEKTILSILNQTYQKFEIIIIYDDQNLEDLVILKRIINKKEKIKILINRKKLGAGLSRNKGIKHAKGEYIAFIDADDFWNKYKLEKQIKFMKQNNCDFTHTSYKIINIEDEIIGNRKARNFYHVDDLIKSCDIGLSTVIISRKIINLGLEFPDLKTKEDFVFWLKILKKNFYILSLDEKLTTWRKLDSSLSSSIIQKLSDAFKVYHKYMSYGYFKSVYYVLCLSINYLKKNK